MFILYASQVTIQTFPRTCPEPCLLRHHISRHGSPLARSIQGMKFQGAVRSVEQDAAEDWVPIDVLPAGGREVQAKLSCFTIWAVQDHPTLGTLW